MIIPISNDADTAAKATSLSGLYPGERKLTCSFYEAMLKRPVPKLPAQTENPITRITFLGHSQGANEFGGARPKELAEDVCKLLKNNHDKLSQLEVIDLCGCEVGRLDAAGECFATKFNQELTTLLARENLGEAYPNLRITAFTTSDCEKSILLTEDPLDGSDLPTQWNFCGLTAIQMPEYTSLRSREKDVSTELKRANASKNSLGESLERAEDSGDSPENIKVIMDKLDENETLRSRLQEEHQCANLELGSFLKSNLRLPPSDNPRNLLDSNPCCSVHLVVPHLAESASVMVSPLLSGLSQTPRSSSVASDTAIVNRGDGQEGTSSQLQTGSGTEYKA